MSTHAQDVLVQVRGLKKYFPLTRGILIQRTIGYVRAVDDISFEVARGETLGLVGESGCGKTTAGRTILGLYPVTEGEVTIAGIDVASASGEGLRQLRQRARMIFQDPFASLNPRWTVSAIVSEPLRVHRILAGEDQRLARVRELLELVGLSARYLNRFPHEFSGGQRQRIGIARALASNPEFIVCDEPISALDVSIQAQIVNLLEDLQEALGLTYLFIAHDLAMVRHLCNRVAVMYLGSIVEMAMSDDLYEEPLHPYTQALLSAVPVPDPVEDRRRKRIILSGEVPSPVDPPPGCRFHTRCPIAQSHCSVQVPEWRQMRPGHWVACHEVQEAARGGEIATPVRPA